MDLRVYPATKDLDERELLSLWWYQPVIFADDIAAGVAPRFFMKGLDECVVKRSEFPKGFNKFWKYTVQAGRMYEDWTKYILDLSGLEPGQASAFEIACNTGHLLFNLKQLGAGSCVGIDRGDLARQQSILKQVTGIHDIDFRRGGWSSDTHSIQALGADERFDIVMCTAFAQHISDPLHLIKELSCRTRKALFLHTSVGRFNSGMSIRYRPTETHLTWGDEFPNNMDTRVSRKLLTWSLKECGFKEIIHLKHSRDWLPHSWYRQFLTAVCLK